MEKGLRRQKIVPQASACCAKFPKFSDCPGVDPAQQQVRLNVTGVLGIHGVRAKYADIRRCTLCYMQRPHYIVRHVQRMRPYRTYVIHTLTIYMIYAGNARHTLDIRFIR